MKFSTLIASFKNGLCSPLVRGRKDLEGIESSAEEYENWWLDSIGGTRRRMGTPRAAGFIANAVSTDTVQNFAFKLLGQDYLFSFNSRYSFNETDSLGPGRPQFLRIGGERIQVFGATTSGTETVPQMRDFNEAAPAIDSGLLTYLDQKLTIIQYTQVSDRTVVFTTNSFSFAVSLVNYGIDTGALGIRPLQMFVMYPHFVNLAQLLANDSLTDGARKCPLYCTNYPFNFPNADTNKKVFVFEEAGQTGTATTSGVLTTDGQKFVALVDIPYSLIPVGSSGFNYFVGAYIRIATQDSKEAVYFLTNSTADVSHSGVVYRRYLAIQTVGGAPSASGTSVFTISTWFDKVGHPKVTTTFKSRLLFANSGKNNASTVFAAAVNSDSPFDYQGFMSDVLIQDASTDASGMKYFNNTNANRRGFSLTFSDGEGQEIRWMDSRRRLHLGTSSGEYQITVAQSFSRDTAEQVRFGTINSDFIQPAGGDRKIIYCANGGKELRSISVEDRDYESIDMKMNAILSGLDVTFKKLQWFEKMRILICLTEEGEVYGLSLDSISQVAGFSLWKFAIDVDDICATNTTCYIIYNALSNAEEDVSDIKAISTLDTEYIRHPDTGEIIKLNHLDSYVVSVLVSAPADFRGTLISIAKMVGECQPVAYLRDKKFICPVIDETSVEADITIDPDFQAAMQVGDALVMGLPYKSRIRSLPQYQGSQYGSAVGDVHRVDRATIQCFDSGMFDYGSEDTSKYTSEGLVYGQTKTKDYTYELPQSSDREQFLVIETNEATPLSISGVALRGVSNSGE